MSLGGEKAGAWRRETEVSSLERLEDGLERQRSRIPRGFNAQDGKEATLWPTEREGKP